MDKEQVPRPLANLHTCLSAKAIYNLESSFQKKLFEVHAGYTIQKENDFIVLMIPYIGLLCAMRRNKAIQVIDYRMPITTLQSRSSLPSPDTYKGRCFNNKIHFKIHNECIIFNNPKPDQ